MSDAEVFEHLLSRTMYDRLFRSSAMSAGNLYPTYLPIGHEKRRLLRPRAASRETVNHPFRIDARAWWVMLIVSVVALGTSGYLAWSSFTASPVAGCDGGSVFNCEHVLHSRWSTVLSLPVSVPALVLYSTVLSLLLWNPGSESATRTRASVLGAASLTAGMAAIWFVGLQIFSLNHLCPYCLVAHGCGIVLATTFLWNRPITSPGLKWTAGFATLSIAGLIALQSMNAEPETFEVIEYADPVPAQLGTPTTSPVETQDEMLFESPVANLNADSSQPIHQLGRELQSVLGMLAHPAALLTLQVTEPAGQPHTVSILNGTKLDTASWPLLGNSDAQFVLVEMYDYTCPHCQRTHATIEKVRKQYGDRLAVITLPVPLDGKCNPTIRSTHASHRESCELAKLAIAVWLTDRSQFDGFHHYLFDAKPGYAQAMAKAKTIVAGDKLDEHLRSTLPGDFIKQHIKLYQKAGAGTIPKFLFPKATTAGSIESPDALIRLINQHLTS
ncbi:Vitamin K epoxide reductase family protein [Stieleria neptunia]|uniref:Vitamin K epoxide reductase family protein n=1 Tax=Stieleria neptunia TaxID=2527979 RepID=A0A518HKE9_9BACT|nr:vitamin K epoxide reductase family protein [Stieleria neptunia]QDV41327.1 Vitamin K epoxide reductase family protein [Stieleria neptunia]